MDSDSNHSNHSNHSGSSERHGSNAGSVNGSGAVVVPTKPPANGLGAPPPSHTADTGFAVGVVVFQAGRPASAEGGGERPDALQLVVQQLQSFPGVTNIEPGGTTYLVRARFRFPEYALAARRQLLEWPGCADLKLRVKLSSLDAGQKRYQTNEKQYLKIGILLALDSVLQEDDSVFVDDLGSLNDTDSTTTFGSALTTVSSGSTDALRDTKIPGLEDPLGLSSHALDGLLLGSTPAVSLYGHDDSPPSQSPSTSGSNPATQGLAHIFGAPGNHGGHHGHQDHGFTQAHLNQQSAPMSFAWDGSMPQNGAKPNVYVNPDIAANHHAAQKAGFGYNNNGNGNGNAMYPHQSPLLYYHQQPQHKPMPRGVISTQLYIDKLPPAITAQQLGKLIESMGLPGFCGVKLGSKNLLPGEFRTAQARFVDSPSASAGLEALHHFVIPGWNIPLSVNFLRGPKKKNNGGNHGNPMHYREPRNSNIFYDAK